MTLALPLLDAMVPASTAAGADGRGAEAAVRRRLLPARDGAGLLGARAGRRASGEAAVHPRVARKGQGSDHGHQRALVEVGRAARRDDRFGSLGGRGVPDRPSSRARPPGPTRSIGSATIDQIIARKIGQESLLPSLQLAVEDPNSSSSNCGEGYSCSYTNSISWIELPTPPKANRRRAPARCRWSSTRRSCSSACSAAARRRKCGRRA